MKISSAREATGAFGVSTVTLWRWSQTFARGGVLALGRDRSGPKGPTKLTEVVTARILALDGQGRTLAQIAAGTAVSTATVRVAERTAARFGDLAEAPVVFTEGAHLPLAGLLRALPALEMTGLLDVATATFGPMSKGFCGLRATLLTGVFMALLREPRAQGATRIAPADLGRVLGLDRAPEAADCPSSPPTAPARNCRPRWPPTTRPPAPARSGSSTRAGTCGCIPAPASCPRRTSPGCGSPARPPRRPG